MATKEAARGSGNCTRARVSTSADTLSIARTAARAVLFTLAMLAVPTLMAALKAGGAW